MSGIEEVAVKRTWTAEDARRVLEALMSSGETVKGFAARHGIDRQRLYAWMRKFSGEKAAFAVVRVRTPAAETDAMLELEVRGVRVRVPRGFDEATLRRVLVALEVA